MAETLIEYYREYRTALFITGFTLGAFLFSMKAVIMQAMKEGYYDREEYQNQIAELRELGENQEYYGNLKKFSNLLITAIWISFFSALLQITLGFFSDYIFVVILCFTPAIYSWILVGKAIIEVQRNWQSLLDLSEDIAAEKNDK